MSIKWGNVCKAPNALSATWQALNQITQATTASYQNTKQQMTLFYNKQPMPIIILEHFMVRYNTGTPHFIVPHFTVFHRNCIFLQIEGKTLSQPKDYDSLKVQMMVSIY